MIPCKIYSYGGFLSNMKDKMNNIYCIRVPERIELEITSVYICLLWLINQKKEMRNACNGNVWWMKIEGELFDIRENAGRFFLYQKVATILPHYLPFSLSLIKSKDSSIHNRLSTRYQLCIFIEGPYLDSNQMPIKYQ